MTSEPVVDTRGGCLSAGCTRDAEYEVLMISWWWPECAEHTATLRTLGPDFVKAVRVAGGP
jgi:hypothetical protein